MTATKTLGLTLAIATALTPVEPAYRPQRPKVGSTNHNRAAQKRQRKARRKSR